MIDRLNIALSTGTKKIIYRTDQGSLNSNNKIIPFCKTHLCKEKIFKKNRFDKFDAVF